MLDVFNGKEFMQKDVISFPCKMKHILEIPIHTFQIKTIVSLIILYTIKYFYFIKFVYTSIFASVIVATRIIYVTKLGELDN